MSGDPSWLTRLRDIAKQRPRTQFVKIRWHDLQQLLEQRDSLMGTAQPEARRLAEQIGSKDYGRSEG